MRQHQPALVHAEHTHVSPVAQEATENDWTSNAAAITALDLAPPDDPSDGGILDAAEAELDDLAGALGVEVPLLVTGAAARQRTAARGTVGLMDGGVVYVDERGAAAELGEVLAHEMVHVAQRRLAGQADPAAAEEEAHRLAAEWSRSGRMGRPQVPLGTAATWELPEGEDVAWHAGGLVLARGSWLLAHGLDPAAGGQAPEANEAFLEILRQTPAWSWIDGARASAADRFVDEAFYHPYRGQTQGADPVYPVQLETSMHLAFGLPPGVDFTWRITPTAAFVTFDTDTLAIGDRLLISAALFQRAFDELASLTGLPAGRITASETVHADTGAVVRRAEKSWLVEQFGEAWEAFPGRAPTGGEGRQGGRGSGPAPTVTFDAGVSEEDQAFARRFARDLPQGEGGFAHDVIDARLIAAWRRIDSHPLRDRILARLHDPPDDRRTRRVAPTAEGYDTVIREVEEAHHAELMQILRDGLDREGPLLDTRLDGTIVQGGGLIFAGQEVPFWFEVQHTPHGDSIRFPVPWCWVNWTSFSTDGTEIDSGTTDHQDLRGFPPDTWTTTFPTPGEYVIRAEVTHTFFQPWAFEMRVEVASEEARRRQMEQSAFGEGPFSQVEIRQGTRFGTADDDRGQFLTGDLPADWTAPDATCAETSRPTWAEQSQPLRDRIAGLQAMADDPSIDSSLRSAAGDRAESLRETLSAQETERGRGAAFFEISAGYLGRLADARTQTLQLQGSARQVDDGVEVILWDQSQAFDTRAHRYEATAETFHQATREAAYDLAKAYPSGRMSVRAEQLDTTLAPTGRWIGWELECNSTWEVVHRAVWDPAAQIAVNVAATAAMVFAPATAVVIVPLLLAYNGVDTVARLWALQESGALEASDVAIGVAELLTDIVPIAGRAARLGRTAIAVLEVAEFGADVLLFSVQAEQTLQEIRANLVDDLHPLHTRIVELERTNPSDPELPGLRDRFERLRAEAAQRAQSQIQEMLAHQGLMAAAGHAAGHLRGGADGETPHIDADGEAALIRADFDPTQPVPEAALPRLQEALGLPVHPELMDGGDIHLHYRRGGDGTLGQIVMSIGRDATLETALQHVHSVRAMRRYRGIAGMLRNTLDHLRTWHRTGHTLSEGGREAMFELEKLEPAVEALAAHLESTPMTETTRARLEAERDSLQAQIEAQRTRLNSTDPGIGVVASHADAADVGSATPHALVTGADVTRPLFAEDGSFRRRELEEAYQRYTSGGGSLDREEWMDHVGGSQDLSRVLEEEMGPTWRERRRHGEVFHEATAGPETTWDIPAGPARDRMDEVAQWREYFRLQRDAVPERGTERPSQAQTRAMLARLRELTDQATDAEGFSTGGPRRDLTRAEWEEFDRLDRRLRQELHGSPARGAVTHASEQEGMMGGDLYLREHIGAERVHPDNILAAGQPGEVDGLYQRGNAFWVLEGKGNTADLGSRRIGGQRYQQGHPRYLLAMLEGMRQTLGDARYHELLNAWRDGRLHYVVCTTPLVSIGEGAAGVPEMGARQVRMREFDIGSEPPQ